MGSLKEIRIDYQVSELDEKSAGDDPFKLFSSWMKEAMGKEKEPTAMFLSTIGENNRPDSRVVLLKDFNSEGFVWFTNYSSKKGKDLEKNPAASLGFFWSSLERQVRISGYVSKISRQESDEYFQSRPYKSKIGAIASAQSSIIPGREFLEEKFTNAEIQAGEKPEMPDCWGGYKLKPDYFEFWQGRRSRMHDRIVYRFQDKYWERFRLSP